MLAGTDRNYYHSYDIPPSTLPQALYPDWAHDHWVWLSSDQANQEAELALVQGYLERNVPVKKNAIVSMI